MRKAPSGQLKGFSEYQSVAGKEFINMLTIANTRPSIKPLSAPIALMGAENGRRNGNIERA